MPGDYNFCSVTPEERRQDEDCKRLIRLVATTTGREREQAFSQLCDLCKKVVWNFAANYFDKTDENLLDPICEEVLWYVWRRAGAYAPDGKFTTWLFKITETFCKKAQRDAGRRRKRFTGVEEASEIPDEQPENEVESLDADEFRRVLDAALAEFDHDMVRLWRLKNEEGVKVADIVRLTGVPESTVNSQIKAINAKLRPIFERFG